MMKLFHHLFAASLLALPFTVLAFPRMGEIRPRANIDTLLLYDASGPPFCGGAIAPTDSAVAVPFMNGIGCGTTIILTAPNSVTATATVRDIFGNVSVA
jgi:hypothetical protein